MAYGLRWIWLGSRRRLSPRGKTFVVTGAASGFGHQGNKIFVFLPFLSFYNKACVCCGPAVTRLLAEQGGFVFAIDLNQELLDEEWRDNPNVRPLRCVYDVEAQRDDA